MRGGAARSGGNQGCINIPGASEIFPLRYAFRPACYSPVSPLSPPVLDIKTIMEGTGLLADDRTNAKAICGYGGREEWGDGGSEGGRDGGGVGRRPG